MSLENFEKVQWKFSGSNKASAAAAATLGSFSSKLYGLCHDNGVPILPPRIEALTASHTAETAVVDAVQGGTGNAYAPSIGLKVARRAVADYLNRDLSKLLQPEDVFMTVGCKQAVELAAGMLAKPNANVLLPKPGYPWDLVNSIFNDLEVRPYEFLQNHEIDIESLDALVDANTVAIFIINPHNPNGNTYTETHLKKLAKEARRLGIMVVSDEVFRWTVFGTNPFVPMGKFSNIVPVVTLGSISKGWSVPGWRAGWLAMHDLDGVLNSTEIFRAAEEFLKINSKPPTVIQAAIPTILGNTPQAFFDQRHKFLKGNADFAYSKLKEIPFLTCYTKPEACTFLWTELILEGLDIEDDVDFCQQLASEENLVLLPGIAFGKKNWVRHSMDMDTMSLTAAFERLKNFYNRHQDV